jgi:hypothetical protein
MTIPIVKTAKGSDQASIIDALRLAFAADPAKGSDQASIIDALRLAFAADPATRWVWPDPQKYLTFL